MCIPSQVIIQTLSISKTLTSIFGIPRRTTLKELILRIALAAGAVDKAIWFIKVPVEKSAVAAALENTLREVIL